MKTLITELKPDTCVGNKKKVFIKRDEELRIVFSRYYSPYGEDITPGLWYVQVSTDEFGEANLHIHDGQLVQGGDSYIPDPLAFIRTWYYNGIMERLSWEQ